MSFPLRIGILLPIPAAVLIVLLAHGWSGSSRAQADNVDEHLTSNPRPLPELPVNPPRDPSIVISVPDRKLAIVKNGKLAAVYPVAVGKPGTPTPVGEFQIRDLDPNPSPPNGVFGARWMEFYRTIGSDGITREWGIHGTNEPGEIGDAVSHGCVRMRNEDVQQVFAQAYTGEPVEIVDKPLGLEATR